MSNHEIMVIEDPNGRDPEKVGTRNGEGVEVVTDVRMPVWLQKEVRVEVMETANRVP